MKENLQMTETIKDGSQVQQIEPGVVETQSEITNGQVKDDQASVDASSAHEKSVKQPKKDYTPAYSDAEKEHLERVTKVCKRDISEAPEKYEAVPFGNNVMISLKKFLKVGGILARPKINRIHKATSQTSTGESILWLGAQHCLLVVSGTAASEAGIEYERFCNDPDKDKPIPNDALVLVIIDGNGRIEFLFSKPVDEWPGIYAVFISPDAAGYYNIPRAFSVINTKVSVWKSEDMVQKRLLAEGSNAHPGWSMINNLVKNGYKYQAACELATLKTDRVKKSEVDEGDADHIFIHYSSAVRIFEALKTKIGEGKDGTLKTKAFPMQVSILWGKLSAKFGDEKATDYFIEFVDNLPTDKVKEIIETKSKKGEPSKDDKRKQILEQQFYIFVGVKKWNI